MWICACNTQIDSIDPSRESSMQTIVIKGVIAICEIVWQMISLSVIANKVNKDIICVPINVFPPLKRRMFQWSLTGWRFQTTWLQLSEKRRNRCQFCLKDDNPCVTVMQNCRIGFFNLKRKMDLFARSGGGFTPGLRVGFFIVSDFSASPGPDWPPAWK